MRRRLADLPPSLGPGLIPRQAAHLFSGRGDTNEALVRAVFAELRTRAPRGIRYASYRLADGVTFIHIASLETPEENPLAALPSFKAFQGQLKDRCVEPPVVTELPVVGSYGEVAP